MNREETRKFAWDIIAGVEHALVNGDPVPPFPQLDTNDERFWFNEVFTESMLGDFWGARETGEENPWDTYGRATLFVHQLGQAGTLPQTAAMLLTWAAKRHADGEEIDRFPDHYCHRHDHLALDRSCEYTPGGGAADPSRHAIPVTVVVYRKASDG